MDNNWLIRFRQEYKPIFKDKYEAFEEALSAPKTRHIRLQLSRNINYMDELGKKHEFIPSETYKGVYAAGKDANITDTVSFQTGGAYIMNPSSAAPASVLSSFMPDNPLILDVSSAPGGKTCVLSDMTERGGLIVANEISSSRLKSLHFNLEKYGCYNVKTVSMDGRLLPDAFPDFFDGVLLDAPCSNENKIFRNKTVQAMWSKELVERMASLQRQLITAAFRCVKEGGVLVYSTCTLSVEENEKVVSYLLSERSDAELLDISGSEYGGISGISEIDDKVMRIMPDKNNIDGFFTAAIKKTGLLKENNFINTKLSRHQQDFFKKYFNGVIPPHISVKESDGRGYMETNAEMPSKIKFKRRGLNIYKHAGNTLEPSCQAIWEMGKNVPPEIRFLIDDYDALEFLKGFDISLQDNYNDGLIFLGDIPVGYAKQVGNSLKNKLDRYFLYGKNIKW